MRVDRVSNYDMYTPVCKICGRRIEFGSLCPECAKKIRERTIEKRKNKALKSAEPDKGQHIDVRV